MKISSIPQLYRNLRRWQEILAILRRYGLADWLSQLKFDFIRDWIKDEQGVPLASYSREKRIRLALTELGPTFIKLGQVLSLRPDLIGPALAQELTSLQSDVPADPAEKVREIVESELGHPISDLYADFNEVPIASASIGQVHQARLMDGTPVVVKVQHADIHGKVNEDLEVMAGLATLANHVDELAVWKPTVLVEQLSKSLRRELNFTRELSNLQVFKRTYAEYKDLIIPQPYPELSTSRVLTMELLCGEAVEELEPGSKLPAAARMATVKSQGKSIATEQLESRRKLAKLVATVYVDMIFVHGLYHADPHPGNVLILQSTQLGLLDFGMVGRIDDRLRETIEEMLLAIAAQDSSLLTTLIKRVGRAPANLDESVLAVDVAELISTYGTQPLEHFDLSGALNDMSEIMHRHQISLPPQTSLLIKMLVTLEGTLHLLSPDFSLLEVMQPFFRKMWLRRFSPKRQAKRLRRIYLEMETLLEKLPGQVTGVMQLLQEGKIDVHLSHKGLGPSINRIVLGLLISSTFLGSSLLLAYQVPPLLFLEPGWMGIERLSLFGLLGYGVSSLALLRLIRAINRSGHLDRSDLD